MILAARRLDWSTHALASRNAFTEVALTPSAKTREVSNAGMTVNAAIAASSIPSRKSLALIAVNKDG